MITQHQSQKKKTHKKRNQTDGKKYATHQHYPTKSRII